MSDHPLEECAKTAMLLIAEGATIYQKYTCANCGRRLVMDEPDRFFTKGKCDECGHVTDIQAQGCNYLVQMALV